MYILASPKEIIPVLYQGTWSPFHNFASYFILQFFEPWTIYLLCVSNVLHNGVHRHYQGSDYDVALVPSSKLHTHYEMSLNRSFLSLVPWPEWIEKFSVSFHHNFVPHRNGSIFMNFWGKTGRITTVHPLASSLVYLARSREPEVQCLRLQRRPLELSSLISSSLLSSGEGWKSEEPLSASVRYILLLILFIYFIFTIPSRISATPAFLVFGFLSHSLWKVSSNPSFIKLL